MVSHSRTHWSSSRAAIRKPFGGKRRRRTHRRVRSKPRALGFEALEARELLSVVNPAASEDANGDVGAVKAFISDEQGNFQGTVDEHGLYHGEAVVGDPINVFFKSGWWLPKGVGGETFWVSATLHDKTFIEEITLDYNPGEHIEVFKGLWTAQPTGESEVHQGIACIWRSGADENPDNNCTPFEYTGVTSTFDVKKIDVAQDIQIAGVTDPVWSKDAPGFLAPIADGLMPTLGLNEAGIEVKPTFSVDVSKYAQNPPPIEYSWEIVGTTLSGNGSFATQPGKSEQTESFHVDVPGAVGQYTLRLTFEMKDEAGKPKQRYIEGPLYVTYTDPLWPSTAGMIEKAVDWAQGASTPVDVLTGLMNSIHSAG